ncbi:Predicted arabinose efflux permease, MFS family [Kushneria avicenniae]|uniref:Predicted arabinose efflux permease, MFS family n=1 Tax=Kushneria avicenniae TaxID=402385 RepID=A0A1I1MRN7_9GAMM|nr:MFS transporter [Kushneria avicenniae]SFC85848.1 Predicted arabinose efflux permease, MFS family [Kushneria avicenniae]
MNQQHRSTRLPATVWWLALCQALLVSGNIMLITINPLIGAHLSPSEALITLPVAAQMLGTTCATLPAGWLTARFGRRRTFIMANLAGLSGIGLAALSLLGESFAGFNLGAFGIGASIGAGMLYRFAAVDTAPDKRDRALSMVMAGGVLAALFGPWLADVTRDLFPVHFLGTLLGLAGLYLTALVIVASLTLTDPFPRGSTSTPVTLTTLLRRPQLAAAILAAAMGYTVMNLAMTATPLAMSHHGHSFEATGTVISAHVLAMFAPSFVTGHLIRRFGHVRMILTGAILLTLSVACALLAPALSAFGAGLVLLGLGWNFTFVPASAWLTRAHRPEEAPRVQALNDCVVFTLVTLSALLAGPLNAWLGWQQLNLWLLIPVALMAWAVAVLNRRACANGSDNTPASP